MDSQSAYLLQKLDCNCNDCGYMVRDFVRHKEKLEQHNHDKFSRFTLTKNKLIESGSEQAKMEAGKMKFQPDSKINEGFGFCNRFNKNVDFIPSICLIHTQKCFVHRKDMGLGR